MEVKSRCRDCGAPIRWLKRPDGRNISVDPSTAEPTNQTYDGERHTPHLSLCTKRPVATCRSCDAPIVWFDNPQTGKKVPVDQASTAADDKALDLSRHVSHFTTCPDRDQFSGRNRERGRGA